MDLVLWGQKHNTDLHTITLPSHDYEQIVTALTRTVLCASPPSRGAYPIQSTWPSMQTTWAGCSIHPPAAVAVSLGLQTGTKRSIYHQNLTHVACLLSSAPSLFECSLLDLFLANHGNSNDGNVQICHLKTPVEHRPGEITHGLLSSKQTPPRSFLSSETSRATRHDFKTTTP